ncbi:AraC family transcriptional regulator [Echinicola sediminis]
MKPTLEQIQVGQEKSIVAFQYSKRDFDAPWHFHPQYELTYIKGSHGTKFIGDYVGPYEPGELVLLQPNLPHCWKNSSHADLMSESVVIQWNPDIFYPAPELKHMFSMLDAASKGLIFSKKDTLSIAPLILKLSSVQGQQLYIGLLEVLANLPLIPSTSLSHSSFTNNLSSEYSNRMSKIHDFIESAYVRKIKLEEIAEMVSMSEQSFSRFFTKMMGRPFFTFLNEYRVNIASKMLLDTDRSVAEIAFECGYESLPFFHKQFSKFKKQTPNKFRQCHAEKPFTGK